MPEPPEAADAIFFQALDRTLSNVGSMESTGQDEVLASR
jgi:hypothetical protein